MNPSGYQPNDLPPARPAPYPSGTPGDWRTFGVGVLLIGLLLCVLAFAPTGADAVRGAIAEDPASRTTPTPPAVALELHQSQARAAESTLGQPVTAGDL